MTKIVAQQLTSGFQFKYHSWYTNQRQWPLHNYSPAVTPCMGVSRKQKQTQNKATQNSDRADKSHKCFWTPRNLHFYILVSNDRLGLWLDIPCPFKKKKLLDLRLHKNTTWMSRNQLHCLSYIIYDFEVCDVTPGSGATSFSTNGHVLQTFNGLVLLVKFSITNLQHLQTA